MKLTNHLRDSFVDKVMEATPTKHYYPAKQAEKDIEALAMAALPAEVKALEKKYPGMLYMRSMAVNLLPQHSQGVAWRVWPCTPNIVDMRDINVEPIKAKYVAHLAEQDERKKLADRLRQVALSCSTLERLKEQLPELIEFMPEPPKKVAWLPVPTNNLVTDLMKAGIKVKKTSSTAKRKAAQGATK